MHLVTGLVAVLVLGGAGGCADSPTIRYVHSEALALGWSGELPGPWFVACEPVEMKPAGILERTSGGGVRAIAEGRTEVSCGDDDFVHVVVARAQTLVVRAPAVMTVGEEATVSATVMGIHDGASVPLTAGGDIVVTWNVPEQLEPDPPDHMDFITPFFDAISRHPTQHIRARRAGNADVGVAIEGDLPGFPLRGSARISVR